MPGISSTAPRYDNWDMDHLDHYQHYFYDDHHDPDEDFFKSTAPSEDIWKKFELVPTPPMSPIRAVEGQGRVGLLHPSLGDKLEWVSHFLGQEDEQQQQQQQHQDLPCKLTASNDSFGNLSSIIIQDCMWSGFSAGQQLERVVGERCASCPGTTTTTTTTTSTSAAKAAAAAAVAVVASPGRTQCAPAEPSALAADCVDPAAVLTFPSTGGCKKQVSSGSESHTDSSDDEDDKDEDEEEIDVVTVEHKQQRKPRRLVNTRKPVTITVRADPMDPGMKRFHISIHQQQHNYAAPSPDTLPTPVEPPRKRVRQEASSQPHQNSHHHHHHHHHHHQPRPGHAPLNLDSRKSHGTAAGVRSESPNFNACSPTSSSSPSSPPSSSSSSSSSSSTPVPSSPSKHLSFSHLSSPQSSDCEDTDKRKAHNFLERKRRNDLRSRFLSLRDEIPGLADCPKTPKVAILTRATEYLQQLHASERKNAQERKQLKSRQLQLLQRLALLKRS
ncbi:LOW QUALITY PROTEIN: protein L-Myc-1b [Anoplopoma fimbria]|uniref:LOW QUALITY PROTEIN: protein L-Myc-1b n=1 Tax=Anoplopoma fimbria TaxID=229290 RepID=UPI0023EB3EF3|nr:LOW QUALITY PROTEIN: protein L-Myc-1b [Anoplopoma fimbria]